MVVEFSHEDYDVIGIVQSQIGTTNALINVVGITSRSTGEIIPLNEDEIFRVFTKRGCVFAHDFMSRYMNFKNECVCIKVMPNANLILRNGDDYVWDKSQLPELYASKVRTLKTGVLGHDGDVNYRILDESGLLDNTSTEYLFSSNKIFKIEPKGTRSKLLPYWDINDATLPIFDYKGRFFVYGSITSNPEGYVDITKDEQLLEWFVKNILKKEWADFYETKDFKEIEESIKVSLKKLKLPSNIFEHRLTKLTSINSNLELTFSELEDIGTSPWFSDIVNDTFEKFEEHYIEKVKLHKAEELKKLQEEHSFNIDLQKEKYAEELKNLKEDYELKVMENNINLLELDEKIQTKKDELNTAEEKVEEKIKDKKAELSRVEDALIVVEEKLLSKQDEITKLESRKSTILQDFSIIKDVMCMNQTSGVSFVNNKEFHLESIDQKDDKAIPRVQPFKKNLESSLIVLLCPNVSVNEIVSRLVTYNILLLPEASVVMAIISATRRCKYITEYVGVDWKSFDDLWRNGLEFIVGECRKDEDTIHFLVLQNINMSYIPSFMQPLFDMEMGLINTFPHTNIEFPGNLKILCTISDDEVIPINRKTLELIGCVAKESDLSLEERIERCKSLDINSAFATGYLTASVMKDFEPDESYILNNSVDTYINADE